MTEHLAGSPDVQRWYGDLFQKIFDSGSDTPLELTVAVLMTFASGRADALSGCHIADTDLPDLLLGHVEMIRQQEFYVLRTRSLPAEV